MRTTTTSSVILHLHGDVAEVSKLNLYRRKYHEIQGKAGKIWAKVSRTGTRNC